MADGDVVLEVGLYLTGVAAGVQHCHVLYQQTAGLTGQGDTRIISYLKLRKLILDLQSQSKLTISMIALGKIYLHSNIQRRQHPSLGIPKVPYIDSKL